MSTFADFPPTDILPPALPHPDDILNRPPVGSDSMPTDSLVPIPDHLHESLTTEVSSDPTTQEPRWQPHDIDLDLMSYKLVKHKYYTPADVLGDIDKIIDNAKHVGELDRWSKIEELAAHAKMHVDSFDPKWTPEFERYAGRMRARKAEKAEKAAKKGLPNGESSSGTALEPVASAADPNASTKRGAEDNLFSDTTKRPREEHMDLDPTVPAHTPDAPQTLEPTIPPPKYPPLIMDSRALATLSDEIVFLTHDFSVDELEQLRARAFDKVWKRRGDWDRGELVRDVRGVVKAFAADAGKAKGRG